MSTLFSYAYGQRAVPKLAEVLSDKALSDERRVQTLTSLRNILSSQEEKTVAVNATPSIVARLNALLGWEDETVRQLSAQCIASLATVIQGRIAISDHGIVPGLTVLLRDEFPSCRTAAAGAFEALASSRDGVALISDGRIVGSLVRALDVDEEGTLAHALGALTSLARLDVGVGVALKADVIAKLQRCIKLGAEGHRALLLAALHTLFNLSQSQDGKLAAINAELVPTLAALVAEASTGGRHGWSGGGGANTDATAGEGIDNDVQRLAVGCIMAISIAKEGKMQAAGAAVPPLTRVLVGAGTDAFTARATIAAIKNIAEYPAAREAFAKALAPHGVDMLLIADGAVWPESNRYVHQNVAPGDGLESDAALRTRWGYPEPHPSMYEEEEEEED